MEWGKPCDVMPLLPDAPEHWVRQLARHDQQQLETPALDAAPDCTVRWGERTFAHSSLPSSMTHQVVWQGPADTLDSCHARADRASGAEFHHRTGQCTVFALDSETAKKESLVDRGH